MVSSNVYEVRFTKDQVEIGRFEWAEVKRIVAYKDDLITVDLVCIEFELNDGLVYLAHDECIGFEALLGKMSEAIPAIAPEWFTRITTPAFERNYTVLFEKTSR